MLYEEGRLLMDAGNLEFAVECFRKSNEISPHFKTFELEGECLFKLGRIAEAVRPLEEAVTLNTGVRAASLLAEVLLAIGEEQRAFDTAEEALRRDPNNKRAHGVIASLRKV